MYDKKYRKSVIISSLIFFSFLIIGVIHSRIDPSVIEKFLFRTQPLFDVLSDLNGWKLALVIFINNGIKVFVFMLLGTILGIFPAIFLALNGYLIGVVSCLHEPLTFFISIVPHGVLEIPALILGAAIGFYLSSISFKKKEELKNELLLAFSYFYKVILPILLIAATVEAFVTPMLLMLVIGS